MATNIEYNGIYVSMDGCGPCIQMHDETEKIISKYVKYHKSINVDHIENKEDELLINALNITRCPTFLLFKKVHRKNIYIGRITGYDSSKSFFDLIEKIKSNSEKNNTILSLPFRK